MAFRGYDIWTEQRPDTIDHGANVLELPMDRKNGFNINPVKCFKQCTEEGICTLNAHFWRFFDSKDPEKDFLLDEDEDKTFYMMGYFELYDLEYEGKKRNGAGMGDDIKVKLGRIRDYELEGAISNALTTAAIGAAVMTTLLLF